jgi:hypothetical protein
LRDFPIADVFDFSLLIVIERRDRVVVAFHNDVMLEAGASDTQR